MSRIGEHLENPVERLDQRARLLLADMDAMHEGIRAMRVELDGDLQSLKARMTYTLVGLSIAIVALLSVNSAL